MAKNTKQAKRTPARRNPFDDPEYRRRADVADKDWAKGLRVYIQLHMLQTAEELAHRIGPEGIAQRRMDLARDDQKFQSFMTEYVRPVRGW
jgi:hypothetical protein